MAEAAGGKGSTAVAVNELRHAASVRGSVSVQVRWRRPKTHQTTTATTTSTAARQSRRRFVAFCIAYFCAQLP